MSSSKKAAQAINEMVQFGQSDQSELLKVIEDYFDDWDCRSNSEDGKALITAVIIIIHSNNRGR